MPSFGPAGRGGARRRTRRRTSRRMNAAAGAAQSQQSPAQEGSDPMEDLKKLGELHQAGVLTDEEFESKKKDILSKI